MAIINSAREIKYLTSAVEILLAQIKDTYISDEIKEEIKETARLILAEIKKEIERT
jgi:hypothetical protein